MISTQYIPLNKKKKKKIAFTKNRANTSLNPKQIEFFVFNLSQTRKI